MAAEGVGGRCEHKRGRVGARVRSCHIEREDSWAAVKYGSIHLGEGDLDVGGLRPEGHLDVEPAPGVPHGH